MLIGNFPQSVHINLSIVELVFNKRSCAVMLSTDVPKIMPSAKKDITVTASNDSPTPKIFRKNNQL